MSARAKKKRERDQVSTSESCDGSFTFPVLSLTGCVLSRQYVHATMFLILFSSSTKTLKFFRDATHKAWNLDYRRTALRHCCLNLKLHQVWFSVRLQVEQLTLSGCVCNAVFRAEAVLFRKQWLGVTGRNHRWLADCLSPSKTTMLQQPATAVVETPDGSSFYFIF